MENYIGLARLRKTDNLNLTFEVDASVNGELIAPFLMLPLVENAFKHVSSFKNNPNWIDIRLSKTDKALIFDVKNSADGENGEGIAALGGIGLTNISRRLELMYPQQHELNISQKEKAFHVNMKIKHYTP